MPSNQNSAPHLPTPSRNKLESDAAVDNQPYHSKATPHAIPTLYVDPFSPPSKQPSTSAGIASAFQTYLLLVKHTNEKPCNKLCYAFISISANMPFFTSLQLRHLERVHPVAHQADSNPKPKRSIQTHAGLPYLPDASSPWSPI